MVHLPLWKIWVRQLGWLFPIYGNMKKNYRSASPSQTHSSGKIKFMFQTTNQIKKDALDGGQSNGRASGETCLILCGLATHIDFTSVHFLKKKRPVSWRINRRYEHQTWFWWVVYLPLCKMMEFVNWDDEIPNIWKVIRFMFETTNQWLLSHTAYLDTNTHEFLWSSMFPRQKQTIGLFSHQTGHQLGPWIHMKTTIHKGEPICEICWIHFAHGEQILCVSIWTHAEEIC